LRKHHTSSKSGASRRSSKEETSNRRENSSPRAKRSSEPPPAPATFREVFGELPDTPEIVHLTGLRDAARKRLAEIEIQPVPTLALHRNLRRAKIGKLRRYILDLEEALAAEIAAKETTA